MSNFMKRAVIGFAMGLAFYATSASALTIIDTYPSSSGWQTSGWGATAQSFTVPVVDNVLSDWTFNLAGSGTNYKFSIVQMTGGLPDINQSLYTVTNPWSVGDQNINGINLSLTSGTQYAAVIDFLGYAGSSVEFGPDTYAGGNGFWGFTNSNGWTNFSGLDHIFQASFVSGGNNVPEPASLALLGLGIAGIYLSKRKKA